MLAQSDHLLVLSQALFSLGLTQRNVLWKHIEFGSLLVMEVSFKRGQICRAKRSSSGLFHRYRCRMEKARIEKFFLIIHDILLLLVTGKEHPEFAKLLEQVVKAVALYQKEKGESHEPRRSFKIAA